MQTRQENAYMKSRADLIQGIPATIRAVFVPDLSLRMVKIHSTLIMSVLCGLATRIVTLRRNMERRCPRIG